MDFYREASEMPKAWESLAITLLEFARKISNSAPNWENEQWVFRPENFVTFRIQRKRKIGITLYLRGEADEFLEVDNKSVRAAVPGYSKIIIDDYQQVPEAVQAIERAYELFRRGRSRGRRSLRVIED